MKWRMNTVAKLTATMTTATGKDKMVDFHAEEFYGFGAVMMRMASADPDAPMSITITRKDVLKRFLRDKENGDGL